MATQYILEQSTDNVNFTQVAIVDGSLTSYLDNSTYQDGTTYYFRLIKQVNGQNSDPSNVISLVYDYDESIISAFLTSNTGKANADVLNPSVTTTATWSEVKRHYYSEITSGLTIPVSNSWNANPQSYGINNAGTLSTAPMVGDSVVTKSYPESLTTKPYVLLGQYVSEPLTAEGPIDLINIVGYIPSRESSTSMNACPAVVVKLVSSNGQSIRGEFYKYIPTTTVNEYGTSTSYYPRPHPPSATPTSVLGAQIGDRIVVEVGTFGNNTSSTSYTAYLRLGSNSTYSDCTTGTSDIATSANPWIEFTLPFASKSVTIGANSATTIVDEKTPAVSIIENCSIELTTINVTTDLINPTVETFVPIIITEVETPLIQINANIKNPTISTTRIYNINAPKISVLTDIFEPSIKASISITTLASLISVQTKTFKSLVSTTKTVNAISQLIEIDTGTFNPLVLAKRNINALVNKCQYNVANYNPSIYTVKSPKISDFLIGSNAKLNNVICQTIKNVTISTSTIGIVSPLTDHIIQIANLGTLVRLHSNGDLDVFNEIIEGTEFRFDENGNLYAVEMVEDSLLSNLFELNETQFKVKGDLKENSEL